MTTQKVTLILDSASADGTPFTRGAVRVLPSFTRLGDPADQVLIEQAPARVSFAGCTAPPSVNLFPNDLVGPQNNDGPGWTYGLFYDSCPGNPPPWSFYLLSAGGAVQRLSGLAAVPAAQPGTVYYPRAGGVPFTGPVAPLDATLADAAAVTVTARANAYTLPLTAAVGASRTVTLAAGLDGQNVTILLVQPASGGPCAVTWPGIDWGRAGSAPALSTAANSADLLGFQWRAALGAWRYLGIS